MKQIFYFKLFLTVFIIIFCFNVKAETIQSRLISDLQWVFEPGPVDNIGTPSVTASLLVDGKKYEIGNEIALRDLFRRVRPPLSHGTPDRVLGEEQPFQRLAERRFEAGVQLAVEDEVGQLGRLPVLRRFVPKFLCDRPFG